MKELVMLLLLVISTYALHGQAIWVSTPLSSQTGGAGFVPADIGMDVRGNVYIYGDRQSGTSSFGLNMPVEVVQKYNAAGILQWTYQCKQYDTATGIYNPYLSDMAVDPAGNCYVAAPPKWNNGSGANYGMMKIDSTGTVHYVYTAYTNTALNQTFDISYSCASGHVIVSGDSTGNTTGTIVGIMDTSNGNLSPLFTDKNRGGVVSGTVGTDGRYYTWLNDSSPNGGSTGAPGYHNKLGCYNISGASPVKVYTTPLKYSNQGVTYRMTPWGMQESNGITASCAYVYTFDGDSVEQLNTSNGAFIKEIGIPGGVNSSHTGLDNSGIAVDPICGYVYVGAKDSVDVFDRNLNYVTSYKVPGIVFGVTYSNGLVAACGAAYSGGWGANFVAQFTAQTCGPINVKTVVTLTHKSPTCGQNNGAISAVPAAFCPNGNFTYLWSPGGLTTQTITGLGAGTYTLIVSSGCITVDTTVTLADSGGGQKFAFTTAVGAGGCATNIWVTDTVGPNPSLYDTYVWSNGSTHDTVLSVTAGTYSVVVTDSNKCKDTLYTTVIGPGTVVYDPTPVQCNGAATGSATVAIIGGTSPYTYVWSPSGGTGATASNLSAGTYTVTVTDHNGCTTPISVTITQPPKLYVSVTSVTQATCITGGGASVSVTGGTGSYSYLWETGQTTNSVTGIKPPVTDTIYVTDANSCKKDTTVTFAQPIFIYTITPVNAICPSPGSATATTTGPGTFTYSWSNGQTGATATGLAIGSYTVTIKDSLCVAESPTVAISGTTYPVISISPNEPIVCKGDSITLTASGATSYVWSPSLQLNCTTCASVVLTPTVALTYTVVGTSTPGCFISDSVAVTVECANLWVPNVFTPNGDGMNDVFHVTTEGLQTYYIEIFNRWGIKLFESSSPDIDWTGKSTSGVQQSDGVYYYIIKATDVFNKEYNLHGFLQLIRE